MSNFIRRALSVFVAATIALGAQVVAPALLPTSSLAAASADGLPTGITPVLVLNGFSGDNGFRVDVTNYDPAYIWDVTSSQGSLTVRLPSVSTPIFSMIIRNIPIDQSATVTVTSSRAGYTSVTSTIVGYAKKTPLTPTFGAISPTYYGYSVQITNFTTDYSWYILSNRGHATLSGTGLITVTGIPDSGSDVLNVTPSRTGYLTTMTTLNANAAPFEAALVPDFSDPTYTETSISVQISNYDPAFNWDLSTNGDGTVTISDTGLVTVSDLYGGQPISLHVSTTRYGYQLGTATYSDLSLFPALIPENDWVGSTPGSFSLQLYNYDPAFDWVATTDVGSIAISSDGLITVTGLSPTQIAHFSIETSRDHTVGGVTTGSARADYQHFTPALAAPISTAGGFTVQITNFDPAFNWSVSSHYGLGTVTFSNSGLITVSGMDAAQSNRLRIIATRNLYRDAEVSIDGTSLEAQVTPTIPQTDASIDSSDSGDVDIDAASTGVRETAEREAAEAQATAKIKAVAEAVIRAKEEAKALAEAKAVAAATIKLQADLDVVSTLNFSSPTALSKRLSKLTAAQVGLIPVSKFQVIDAAAVTAIGEKQASGISAAQLRAMPSGLLSKLKPIAVGALKPDTLGSLSVAKLKALTKAQVKQIWAAQLLQLDPGQRKAIKR